MVARRPPPAPASRKGFVLNFAGSVASGLWAAWEPPARIATSTAPEPSPAPARRRDRPRTHRVFFPFFGGVDDRVALRFVMQLARNPAVTATVAHFEWPQEDYDSVTFPLEAVATVGAAAAFAGPSSSSSFPPPPLPPRRWSAAKRATGNVIEQVSAMDQALLATLRTALPADMAARVRFVEVDVASGEAGGGRGRRSDRACRCRRPARRRRRWRQRGRHGRGRAAPRAARRPSHRRRRTGSTDYRRRRGRADGRWRCPGRHLGYPGRRPRI